MTIRTRTDDLLAFRTSIRADHLDVQRIPLAVLGLPPTSLAEAVFDIRHSPGPVRALMGLRQLLVPLIGLPPTRGNPFKVDLVEGGEALIEHDEPHMTFWCSVGERDAELIVATAVRLKGWRGRLYWLPVGILHAPITRAMMRRGAARLLARADPNQQEPVNEGNG